MTKVKYTGISGSITSGKIKYTKGSVIDVSDEVAKYLKATFNSEFEFIETAEKATKPTPTKATKTTKVVEEK